MSENITAVKNRSQRPYKQKAESEALFMSMGDAVLTTDEFGLITRINPPALKLLGYDRKDLIGKPLLKMIAAESLDGHRVSSIDRPITQAFLTGHPVAGKMYYITKTGNLLPVAVNVSPVMHGGKPIGAVEVFRDVTFEHEIDQMKSEFISLASHQLRTPLSAIKTYAHMLRDGYMGELNEHQKQSIDTIILATNRMNELISTLLNITKIESGKISTKRKLIKLDKVLNEIMPELKPLAESKEIDLCLKTVGKLATDIRTDALIVKEITTSLVSNAIKYTPDKGSIEILVKPRQEDILVEVSDTGWGIPVDARAKVFSKFFRGDNIVKHETSGTGLGLYLAKGLLDNLNGQIWFKSKQDCGTSFYFTIPRRFHKARLKEGS